MAVKAASGLTSLSASGVLLVCSVARMALSNATGKHYKTIMTWCTDCLVHDQARLGGSRPAEHASIAEALRRGRAPSVLGRLAQ